MPYQYIIYDNEYDEVPNGAIIETSDLFNDYDTCVRAAYACIHDLEEEYGVADDEDYATTDRFVFGVQELQIID